MKDQLTGLLNPDAFRLLVEHELIVSRRLGRIDTLLVIDVENLQSVNHIFGREGGDETLRSIGRLLQRTARESDIIGRIGDDEFAIFALDCVGDALAKRISSAVVRSGDGALTNTNRELTVRIRVGLTEVGPGEEFDELMTRAGPAAFLREKRS
ncbi:MAG TPA: GGDEF domain-containing protein [Gemmatimonadaceae bacterium]